ncbi:PAS domain-containing protein [Pedobacter xixiisoli]|uniref:histidine kinase n=1 Tax=Pedobacter xixiisoli TaxID=1476464 RepID=A0A285ZUS3_9SPHI|nr:PAS domain-containing protein [Pedobacter xixiisoli]SOD13382.1 PAS domain S-box-containing protein [Pedobacter xixiisoli]
MIQKLSSNHLTKLWSSYSNFIENRTYSEKTNRSQSEIWKDRVFTQIVKFAFPTAVFPLTVSIIIEYFDYNYLTAIVDLVAFLSVVLVVISKKTTIQSKKYFGIAIMIIFSLVKIITLHSLLLGTIYLLLSSVITTLLLNKKAAYLSVALNATICICFTIAQMKGFPMHKLNIYNSDISIRWILFTFNIIFVNSVMVSVIIYITDGFEKTIEKSKRLSAKLKMEVKEKVEREKLLQETTTHYKSLFYLNPFPILIYNPSSLHLLNINKAAINQYRYSKKEFLNMKINNLADCTEVEFKNRLSEDNAHYIGTHIDKTGEKIIADMYVSSIKLDGISVRLAIVRNITAETEYIATIARKKKKMREIAFLQSHVIRKPLSQILGIIELIKAGPIDQKEFEQLLSHLISSTEELDIVVTDIIHQTR